MSSTNSRFVALMLSIPVVAGLLIGGCCSAAGAAELSSEPTCSVIETECTARPLANGRPGETVTMCEHSALVCASTPVRRLAGTTTLFHARHGRLVAAR